MKVSKIKLYGKDNYYLELTAVSCRETEFINVLFDNIDNGGDSFIDENVYKKDLDDNFIDSFVSCDRKKLQSVLYYVRDMILNYLNDRNPEEFGFDFGDFNKMEITEFN